MVCLRALEAGRGHRRAPCPTEAAGVDRARRKLVRRRRRRDRLRQVAAEDLLALAHFRTAAASVRGPRSCTSEGHDLARASAAHGQGPWLVRRREEVPAVLQPCQSVAQVDARRRREDEERLRHWDRDLEAGGPWEESRSVSACDRRRSWLMVTQDQSQGPARSPGVHARDGTDREQSRLHEGAWDRHAQSDLH